jgi:hypothetical protein
MAYKNRFFKTSVGVDAEILVAKAVEYTNDATLKDFVANAVDGEIAVINASTGAVVTSAPAAGTELFIAVKRGDTVERSTIFKAGSVTVTKDAYVAPVKHVVTVASTGTQASLEVQDLTFTAVAVGEDGNDITITFNDPAGNNAALGVVVTGTDIVVNLATDGASAPTSTATLIAAAIEGSAAASALVSVEITGTGSDVAAAAAEAPLAGGVDEAEVTKGDYFEVVIIETTPNLEPLPRWAYSVEARAGESYTDVITRLVAKINDSQAIENRDKTLIVDAAVVDGNSFTLTAIDFNSHFKVALRGVLAEEAEAEVTTQFKFGAGTPEQVRLAEAQGDIRKGVTTNYPSQNATPAEFGAPDSMVSDSNTYNAWKFEFDGINTTRTLDKEFRKNYIFLYVPSNGTNPDAEIDTIF